MAVYQICYGFNDITCGEFIHAIYTNDTQKVKLLLDAGQDPFERDSDGNGPYFWASFLGDVPMIQAIADAQRKRGGIQGLTLHHLMMALPESRPLDAEAMRRFQLLVQLLNGADTLKTEGSQLLSLAVHRDADSKVVEFLLGLGIRTDGTWDRTGNTPLHDACELGRADLVKLLLEESPDTGALNQKGETPLKLAMNALIVSRFTDAAECVKLLQNNKAAVIPALNLWERLSLRRAMRQAGRPA